jgi:hypothetical protein
LHVFSCKIADGADFALFALVRSTEVAFMVPAVALASAAVILACARPQPAPVIVAPPPPVATVDFDVQADPPDGAAVAPAPVAPAGGAVAPGTRNQPPELKLKLGHFTDKQHNIGLVIDRTGHEAKLRFDGGDVMRLDPQRSSGRIEYVKVINRPVLQVWDDGRVSVFVPGHSDSIDVVRDADADPL